MENIEIIYTLVSFLVVGLIFMLVLGITFKILLKKYSVDNAKIKFYGLFLGMKNSQILAFSMVSLNYLFLIYNLISFNKLNVVILIFSMILVILSDIVIKNYSKGLLNILYEIISILTIIANNYLYNYIVDNNSPIIIVCLVFVIILSVLFYSYVMFKTLNNIIVKDKHIKEDKYSL